ncbi:MAG: carbamoyltransferase HypF, partial [Candidatus Omnitrophica bacterium]|nr:carbamoyltransferase HypF [Candidatus Omnitrophota bacterium]
VLSILGRKGASLLKKPKKEEKEVILSMMSKNINSPLTSSAGRLFDAAAALLGVCEYASYEAEGPIRLEAMCRDKIEESYRFKMLKCNGRYIIDTQSVFLGMVKDLAKGIDKGIIATKFHNSMAKVIVNTAKRLSNDVNIYDIALSGGVFQNRFLKTKVIKELSASKLNVFTNTKTPVNDLNISLGQYYVSSRTGRS